MQQELQRLLRHGLFDRYIRNGHYGAQVQAGGGSRSNKRHSLFFASYFHPKKTFDVADRANLLHVSYQLAFLGSKTYATPSVLSSYLDANELDLVPWMVFCFHVERIATVLEQKSAFQKVSVMHRHIERRNFQSNIQCSSVAKKGLRY
jgi:hypothetical protein